MVWKLCDIIYYNTTVNQEEIFAITDTKLYVPGVTLSTQDNVKLIKQLELGLARHLSE